VKSRYDCNAAGFPIANPKADFIVFARLNLDSTTSKEGERSPECYVFPAGVVRRVIEIGPSGKWPKCHLRRIRNVESYKEAWHLIAKALKLKLKRATPKIRAY
jgi:hypothetical protein